MLIVANNASYSASLAVYIVPIVQNNSKLIAEVLKVYRTPGPIQSVQRFYIKRTKINRHL